MEVAKVMTVAEAEQQALEFRMAISKDGLLRSGPGLRVLNGFFYSGTYYDAENPFKKDPAFRSGTNNQFKFYRHSVTKIRR